MSVTMLESGARGFANAVKRLAVKDKKFAEELVYMHGIRSEITPNALKGITKDMFGKGGKLTEQGRKEVTGLLKRLNLPKNATWDDALAAVKASKEKVAAKLKAVEIPKPEIFNKVKDIKIPNSGEIAKKIQGAEMPDISKLAVKDLKLDIFNKYKGMEMPKIDIKKFFEK